MPSDYDTPGSDFSGRVEREILKLERQGRRARSESYIVIPDAGIWRRMGNRTFYRLYGLRYFGKKDEPKTAGLQAAVDTANSKVFVKDALYLMSASLNIPKEGMTLEGESAFTDASLTVTPANLKGTVLAPKTGFTSGNYLIVMDGTAAVIRGNSIRNMLLQCVTDGDPALPRLSGGINAIGCWDLLIDHVLVGRAKSVGIRSVKIASVGNSNWINHCTVMFGDAAGIEIGNFESGVTNCSVLNCDIGYLLSTTSQQRLYNCIDDTNTTWGFQIQQDDCKLVHCSTFGRTLSGSNLRIESSGNLFLGQVCDQGANANGNTNISDSGGHSNNQFIGCQFMGPSGTPLASAIYSSQGGLNGKPHRFIGGFIKDPARYTTLFAPTYGAGTTIGFIVQGLNGFNPANKITSPFRSSDSPKTVGPFFGELSAPVASTDYEVMGTNILMTSTGGTAVSITIKDGAGNTVASGLTTLTAQYLPIGYKVNFGAFSVAPTVTVFGD